MTEEEEIYAKYRDKFDGQTVQAKNLVLDLTGVISTDRPRMFTVAWKGTNHGHPYAATYSYPASEFVSRCRHEFKLVDNENFL